MPVIGGCRAGLGCRYRSASADVTENRRHVGSTSAIGYRMALTLALYQPDIAGNTGAILRLGACLGVDVSVIEPTGFDMSDRALKRSGMDYLAMVRSSATSISRRSKRWRRDRAAPGAVHHRRRHALHRHRLPARRRR